ncbi:hypothetical protein [Streptomyces noursei]|uniref:hypothetical protein n=1 Tax=Streptomyces noursei TaxID=1971 RepID=UPI001352093B
MTLSAIGLAADSPAIAAAQGDTLGGRSFAGESVTIGKYGKSKKIESGLAFKSDAGVVADDGFRPERDGFGFANYGSEATPGEEAAGLSEVEMRKMFGDGVCVGGRTDECTLTPQAADWMKENNEYMKGGHCYGFSVASLLMWKKEHLHSNSFGADKVPELRVEGNLPLQHQLAYSWSSFSLAKVQSGRIAGPPNQILDKLIEVLKPEDPEGYTLSFYKQDGSVGHAVTPYAVKDKGNGEYDVLIYDNNHPGEEQVMNFDRSRNTWSYADLDWGGGEGGPPVLLDPASPSVQQSPAPFDVDSVSQQSATETEISLNGSFTEQHAHLLITDDKGRRTGFLDGKVVNEIPGAKVRPDLADGVNTSAENPEPEYAIPAGTNFNLTIDGANLKAEAKTGVDISSGSRTFRIEDIDLKPGDVHVLDVSGNTERVTYKTNDAQSPTLALSNGHNGDYYELEGNAQLKGEGATTFDIAPDDSKLTLSRSKSGSDANYGFTIKHETSEGVREHIVPSVHLTPGATGTLDLPSWSGGKGKPFKVESN